MTVSSPNSKVNIEDITRLSFVSNPSIDPEGSMVAYVLTKSNVKENSYRSSIWIASGGQGYRPLTAGPNDRCPSWNPSGGLLAFSRTTVKDNAREHGIYIASISGGEPWLLKDMRFPASKLQWSPMGDAIGFIYRAPISEEEWRRYEERDVLEIERIPVWFNGDGWVFDRFFKLAIVSYPGGELVALKAEKDANIIDFDFSPDGSSIVYVKSYDMLRPYKHKVIVWNINTGEEVTIMEGPTVASVSWDPRGRFIALKANDRRRGLFSHFKILVYDTNLEELSCLTCDLDRNVMNTVNSDSRGPSCLKGLYWDEHGHVYFGIHDAGRMMVARSKPHGEAEIVLSEEGATIDDFTISRDGETIAYIKMSPTHPADLFMYSDGDEQRLTYHNQWFTNSKNLAEPVHMKVESPHGGSIDAWVILPSERGEGERIPWILYIHGGPKTSYGYAFIHEFQMLASRGFAVIYSNPRGSDGYSEEFADLRGRYGIDDFEEIMKVVDEAISSFQELDPDRGGVTGGSYGGYMTNTIVSKTSRFKAAVTQRSCSEWIGFFGESDIGWYFAPELLGASEPWKDVEKYVKFSPLFKVENIETPLLIIHSTDDYRCPLAGAIELFTALKLRGVDTKLAVFPGETHDLSRSGRPRRRIARLREIVSWFEKYLKASNNQ